VESALAGRVSAALSVVTELNFPLSGPISRRCAEPSAPGPGRPRGSKNHH
jgi:hypothetical protein